MSGGGTTDLTEEEKDCLEPAINTVNWEPKEDGYYYYREILQPGEEGITEPLFDSVHFNGPKMGNEYLGSRLTLRVQAFGVQSDNNVEIPEGGSVSDMADQIGWPEEPTDESPQF